MARRTFLHDGLSASDWEHKAAACFCLVCDASKGPDSICCNACWTHLDEARQTQIINLLRDGRIGWALRKMCAWAGRASLPSKRDAQKLTAKLFEEAYA